MWRSSSRPVIRKIHRTRRTARPGVVPLLKPYTRVRRSPERLGTFSPTGLKGGGQRSDQDVRQAKTFSGATVLLVEDDDLIRLTTTEMPRTSDAGQRGRHGSRRFAAPGCRSGCRVPRHPFASEHERNSSLAFEFPEAENEVSPSGFRHTSVMRTQSAPVISHEMEQPMQQQLCDMYRLPRSIGASPRRRSVCVRRPRVCHTASNANASIVGPGRTKRWPKCRSGFHLQVCDRLDITNMAKYQVIGVASDGRRETCAPSRATPRRTLPSGPSSFRISGRSSLERQPAGSPPHRPPPDHNPCHQGWPHGAETGHPIPIPKGPNR